MGSLGRIACISVLCLTLAACELLLGQDFRKATLVSDLELGAAKTYARTLNPPAGSATLILAVPNYRCLAVEDAPISLVVRDSGRTIVRHDKRLSELTWSYGEGSCDAYGYVYDASRIDIPDSAALTFEVDVSQVKSVPQRRASVWLVYGGRVPAAEIFAEGRR